MLNVHKKNKHTQTQKNNTHTHTNIKVIQFKIVVNNLKYIEIFQFIIIT